MTEDFFSFLVLVYSDVDNISLRFLFHHLKTIQTEVTGNMFLRYSLSECKTGTYFLIRLLIFGNIKL